MDFTFNDRLYIVKKRANFFENEFSYGKESF